MFERETQFIAITEAVHARILAAQVAELSAADRVYQVFTDLALYQASEQEVVDRASDLAGVPVILADLAHRVLACAGKGQQADELLAGFAGKSRAVRIPGRTGYDKAAGWLSDGSGEPELGAAHSSWRGHLSQPMKRCSSGGGHADSNQNGWRPAAGQP